MVGAASILIGIQARSTSTRLPDKVNLRIEGRTLLQHVMDACFQAEDYLNRVFRRDRVKVQTAVLAPWGDPLIPKYDRQVTIFAEEGVAESDVLTRYVRAVKDTGADYVVRITSDCVYTMPYMISRCVKSAIKGPYDYTSNVRFRTFPEGLDVEVLSRPLLLWLDEVATGSDREHVTSAARFLRQLGGPKAPEFRVCHIMDVIDLSGLKTSIDTPEEYQRVVTWARELREKKDHAQRYGATIA